MSQKLRKNDKFQQHSTRQKPNIGRGRSEVPRVM